MQQGQNLRHFYLQFLGALGAAGPGPKKALEIQKYD